MAKVIKAKRVLFFINGPVASPEDHAEALALAGQGFDVVFRNAMLVTEDHGCVEPFDELAGEVPPVYERAAAMKANNLQEQFNPEPEDAPNAAKPGKIKKKGGKTEKPAADPARDAALAALGGGQQQAPAPAAPNAPETPPAAPAGGQGPAPAGWGGQQQPAPGNAPGWTPNA